MADTTTSDLSYLSRTKYGTLIKLLNPQDKLQMLFPFVESQKPTNNGFVEAVELEFEAGFTLGGNLAAPDLLAASAGQGAQATIVASQIIGRKKVGNREIYRFNTEDEANKFATENENRLRQLILGHRRMTELSLLHGQSVKGLGVIATGGIGSTDGSNNTTLTLTADSWSAGIWAGAQGMYLAIYDPTLTTQRTTVTLSTMASGNVPCPDVDNKTITVKGSMSGVQAGDVIVRDPGNSLNGLVPGTAECQGLMSIARTKTGNLMNLPVQGHYLWRPEQYAVNGPLKMTHIQRAAARLVPKGVTDTTMMFLISELAWIDLHDEIMALRFFDSSYKSDKIVNGVEVIEYHGQTGKIQIAAHPYMQLGDGLGFPYDENLDPAMRAVKRIGSVDFTLEQYDPEGGGKARTGGPGTIFWPLSNTAGREMRSYSDQAVFPREAGKLIALTGITQQSAANA